jgi:hypothetical protein
MPNGAALPLRRLHERPVEVMVEQVAGVSAWCSRRISSRERMSMIQRRYFIGLTSIGAGAEPVPAGWPDGTLAEHALMSAERPARGG